MKTKEPNLLQPRELEMLRYVAQGCTNEQIADKILRSVGLVEKELPVIFRKLGAINRPSAVHNAWIQGLFTKKNC